MRFQFLPHLVERAWRTRNALLFPETLQRIPLGVHAPDLVDHQLQPLVEQVSARLNLDELAGVKLVLQLIHVLKHLGFDLAGDVLQHQRQVVAALAGAQFLPRAQEVTPAIRRADQFRDLG